MPRAHSGKRHRRQDSAKILNGNLRQINAQLRESTRQILLQENRQRREKTRREQFEKPLSARAAKLRVDHQGRLMLYQRTSGVFDGEHIMITRKGHADNGPKSLYSKRFVSYVYDREGKFLQRMGILSADVRKKLRSKKNQGQKVSLGEGLTGSFDGKHFQIQEIFKTKSVSTVSNYQYGLQGKRASFE